METVAVKLADVAPAATVTPAGTVTAELLLATLTAYPPVRAAVLRETVQLSVPEVVIDPLLQLKALSTGTPVPVPVRLIKVEAPEEELLVSVRVPEVAPATRGSNCTVRVAVCLGFNVTGKLIPETVKPVPATVAALTVTAEVPVEDRVMVCEVAVLTLSLPKDRLEELKLSVGTDAPSCRPKVFATLLALAVSVVA